MVNEARGGVKNGRGQKALRGAEAPLLNDVACFVVISISGVLFLFDHPFLSAIASRNCSYIGSKEQTDCFGR